MNFLVPEEILKARNPVIDFYRAIAILSVLLFHYDYLLSIGFIGVDLFFLISGYLVSRELLLALKTGKSIRIKNFFIKRISKIIPSYYFFILFGTIIARLLLLESHQDQVISLHELPEFIFFYVNYSETFCWSFELAWSLCVEEHFYLFLAFIFLLLSLQKRIRQRIQTLKTIVISFILLAFFFKVLGYYNGWDTYTPTHMRMDALFLGVLLSFQEIVEGKIVKNSIQLALIGSILLSLCIILFYTTQIPFFTIVLLHTLVPLSFYLIIRGTLFSKQLNFKPLRIMAYYSYNWYLWHALIAYFVLNFFNFSGPIGLGFYLSISFFVAVLMTKIIEEPVIKMRSYILKK